MQPSRMTALYNCVIFFFLTDYGEGDFDDYDDFLETDDALNMERWDRS